METATIYLHTALFTYDKGGADSHVPRGTTVVEGKITERPAGCVSISVTALRDSKGRDVLDAAPIELELQLPWSKIDHIQVHQR